METFAVGFGIQCLASEPGEDAHAPFYVGMDAKQARCPECGKVIRLDLFKIANRTLIIGVALLDGDALENLSFGFADQIHDENRNPAEIVASEDYEPFRANFSINELNIKRQGEWMRFCANPDYTINTSTFTDVLTHANHPLAGEEYLPQGYLAPLIAGIQLWNTAYAMACYECWQVWPAFLDDEQ